MLHFSWQIRGRKNLLARERRIIEFYEYFREGINEHNQVQKARATVSLLAKDNCFQQVTCDWNATKAV